MPSECPLLSTCWNGRLGSLTPVETSGFCPMSSLETEITRPFRCCSSGHASEAKSNRQGLTCLRLQLPSCRPEPRQSGPASLSGALHQPLPILQGGMLQKLRLLTSPYLTASAEQIHQHYRCSPIYTYTHVQTYTHVHIYLCKKTQQCRTCMYLSVHICMYVYKLVLFIHQIQVPAI